MRLTYQSEDGCFFNIFTRSLLHFVNFVALVLSFKENVPSNSFWLAHDTDFRIPKYKNGFHWFACLFPKYAKRVCATLVHVTRNVTPALWRVKHYTYQWPSDNAQTSCHDVCLLTNWSTETCTLWLICSTGYGGPKKLGHSSLCCSIIFFQYHTHLFLLFPNPGHADNGQASFCHQNICHCLFLVMIYFLCKFGTVCLHC